MCVCIFLRMMDGEPQCHLCFDGCYLRFVGRASIQGKCYQNWKKIKPILHENLYFVIKYCTWITKNCVSIKANLENYKGLIDPREHIQNMKRILELITQDHDAMCKVFPTTLRGSTQAWYHSIEFGLILHFHDFSSKLIYHFSTIISTKKIIIKLFVITQ
jgi:hypothetical protein